MRIKFLHGALRTFTKSSTSALEISSENAKRIELRIMIGGMMNYGAIVDRFIQKTFTDMLLFLAFECNAEPFEYFLCMTPYAMH
jgi:hypothetical protein